MLKKSADRMGKWEENSQGIRSASVGSMLQR